MDQAKRKFGGKMPRKKKIWALVIGLLILLLLASGVLTYLIQTGRLNFKADTTPTIISNTVYGTYSSDQGTGNVTSNEIRVQVSP